jgi:hypothetical protein
MGHRAGSPAGNGGTAREGRARGRRRELGRRRQRESVSSSVWAARTSNTSVDRSTVCWSA